MLVSLVCPRKIDPFLKNSALERGIVIQEYQFIHISYLDNQPLRKKLQASTFPFVFTSIHAVKATEAIAQGNAKNCFCIKGNTARYARQMGFAIAAEAENAGRLAGFIIANAEKQVIHLTANIRRRELYEQLASAGIVVDVCEVYHKTMVPQKVGRFDAVLFFSPSQIDAFLAANELKPDTPSFCIGSTTSAYLSGTGHLNIIQSAEADQTVLMQRVFEYFNC